MRAGSCFVLGFVLTGTLALAAAPAASISNNQPHTDLQEITNTLAAAPAASISNNQPHTAEAALAQRGAELLRRTHRSYLSPTSQPSNLALAFRGDARVAATVSIEPGWPTLSPP